MSKSKLYKRLLELEKENEALREENAYLKFELEELRSKRYKPNKKTPLEEPPLPPQPRKKGALFGHIGWFRKKPKIIDKIEDVTLSECPVCGSNHIIEYKDIDEHLQEDIILPKVETTLFRKHKYYCKKCKRIVIGKGHDELPNSYIGPRAKSLALFLKYVVKISERDIKNIFEKMFNLKIAASSFTGFKDQLRLKSVPSQIQTK